MNMKSLFGGCHPGYDYYQLIINNVIIIIELLQSIKRKMEKNSLSIVHPTPLITKILEQNHIFLQIHVLGGHVLINKRPLDSHYLLSTSIKELNMLK